MKHFKKILGALLLLATLGAFSYYLNYHRELLTQLRHVHPSVVIGLLAAYTVNFLALAIILHVTMRMYRKKLGSQENMLLSAYSSLLNFFGPGQSGPGLRALYLKKKYDLRIKDYVFATLLYYACYAILSAFLLVIGSRPWWQTIAFVGAATGVSLFVLRWYAKRSKIQNERRFNLVNGAWMFAATALQMVAQVAIYGIELHAVSHHVSFSQIITYTGAANFALFVALTPGAIGIRESFLLFSQKLHHIGSAAIVTANLIDRAVYLLFLGILFVLVLSLHAGKKLKLRQLAEEETNTSNMPEKLGE